MEEGKRMWRRKIEKKIKKREKMMKEGKVNETMEETGQRRVRRKK